MPINFQKLRKGVAAVEFAVVLPPVVLILLGTIEASRAFSVLHTLQEASMNGCRLYSLREKTQTDVAYFIDQSLTASNISGYTVTFDPPDKNAIDSPMEPVSVTISVPYSNVSIGVEWFMKNSTVTARSVLPADMISGPPSP